MTKAICIEDILREYERIRLENKRILQNRKQEIYSLIPRIEEIDQIQATSYLEVAKLRVLGKDQELSHTKDISQQNRKLTVEKKSLLVNAGYDANYLEPIYKCSLCQDTGYRIPEGADSPHTQPVKCKCFIDRIINSLYLQSNLKNILDKENFSTFSMDYYSKNPIEGREYSPYDNMCGIIKHSKEFVNAFDASSSNRGSILIYGETGMGKTFLTNCIAKELLDKGHSVLYLSANELFETVLAGYLLNQKNELEELYHYIYNSELLIIDDLGTELTNNFVLSQLFEIINQREISGKSTLISTNFSMKQLRDRYSERIMSRIIAGYTVFNIYGENIRYQKRKKEINEKA